MNYIGSKLSLLEFLEESINKVIDIDGEPLPDAVFAELWQKISAL